MYQEEELLEGILEIFTEAHHMGRSSQRATDDWRVGEQLRLNGMGDDWRIKREFKAHTQPGVLHVLPRDGYVIVPVWTQLSKFPCPKCGAPRERRRGLRGVLIHLGKCSPQRALQSASG